MCKVTDKFGSMIFGDKAMRERLPAESYNALKKSVQGGEPLSLELANVIADAMKNWAIEKGATHFTHWFQPMTGITAEKHDSFITPRPDGTAVMEFSGKELIKGEPDASSFPSGGLRSTFEARGYTAWDASSYAFIKEGTLCIPTVFISYSGQVLDKKTPLLRSKNALAAQVKRFMKIFGKDVSEVDVTVGAEQEYFLISREMFLKRKDLITTGRTLLGARPPKGQELEDHYFGSIKPKVLEFMNELDSELWKLGVFAKTRHNEAAPAQHELAPIFTTVNAATDQNQLTMEIMKTVAARHGLTCLLHEKPFSGVNGSGKHNNWSVTADKKNLLSPGKNPETNLRFLLFMAAVIKAVDTYQDLLRLSVATAGNDHRLGSHEAPPAIISMFLGSEITAILESMADLKEYAKKSANNMKLGVTEVSSFLSDTSDRNRTSPFAFTGNKFEFRMLGSSINIACPNTILNTMVADSLAEICDTLNGNSSETDIKALIAKIYTAHKRIVFNGNNYSAEWTEEAKKRGLFNLKTAPQALSRYDNEKNVALFKRHSVYTSQEVNARKEILLENYSKIIRIEALTLLSMVNKEVLPAAAFYSGALADSVTKKSSLGIKSIAETEILTKISALTDSAYAAAQKLESEVEKAAEITGKQNSADNYCNKVFTSMLDLRAYCDKLEALVAKKFWPFPTYSDLLFSI